MHDLVIRNGRIIDGSGKPGYLGDVTVEAGKIVAVGGKAGVGAARNRRRRLAGNARMGRYPYPLRRPDLWDPYLCPSSWHGVTTVVMGNCGVGFAPVARGQEDFLIGMMETVEDIPGRHSPRRSNGNGNRFREYLDAIGANEARDRRRHPGAALRGARLRDGRARHPQRGGDPRGHRADGGGSARRVEAGALGLSTSRTAAHRAKSKDYVPGTFATQAEMIGIGRVLGEAGHGVFEIISDLTATRPKWSGWRAVEGNRPARHFRPRWSAIPPPRCCAS